MESFAQRWRTASKRKGSPVCVGLDPVFGKLPPEVRRGVNEEDREAVSEAMVRFCSEVIDAVAEFVPCVKVQLACFERYGWAGFAAYERVVQHAKGVGLLVIADAKRGDIGISAEHYAAAFFEGPCAVDALTVSPYLGPDTLEPFINAATISGGAVFVLVRTSNPGSGAWQGLETLDALRVVDHIADFVERESARRAAGSAFGPVGAVVGATHPREAAALRQRMPHALFLVPGFGAQGGGAQDVWPCFHDHGPSAGAGAIITASRSVIYASPQAGQAWGDAVRGAAVELRDQIAAILA